MIKNLGYLLTSLLCISVSVKAQYISLMPGFGINNGYSFTNFQALPGTTIKQVAHAVLIQTDGKIVLVCESARGSILLRFNDDGSPDISFGVGGRVVVYAGIVTKALLQSDGKILMATGNIFIRYNNNGTPDLTFGNNALVKVQAGYLSSTFFNMTLQPDGKIIAVGNADYFVPGLGYTKSDAVIIRLLVNGVLDTSFNSNGIKLVPVQSNADIANAVALDFSDYNYPTGKIVIAGENQPAVSGRHAFVARVLPDGTLDNSFGTGGVVEELYSNNCFGYDVKVFADGKIIVGGGTYIGATNTFDLTLIKYNVNGTRDNSFSGDGITIKPSGNSLTSAPVKEIQLLSSNKFIVLGARPGGGVGLQFCLTQYNADGSLDNSFNGNGVLPAGYNSSNFDYANALTIDNNGRYLLAGETNTNYGKSSLALNRYNTNGSLDVTFSEDGKYANNDAGSLDYGQTIIRQSDGKLLVGGLVKRLSNAAPVQLISEFVVIRYNSNGSIDNSWGTNGIKYTGLVTNPDKIYLALQSDGKIVTAYSAGFSVTVSRFTSTGTADLSFDSDGKVTFNAIGGYALSDVKGIAITSGGKIVITCTSTYSSTNQIALLQLNANGSKDNTYGYQGLNLVGLGEPVTMLMQANDNIMLVVTNNPQGNLKRILPSGSTDASFGGGTVRIVTNINSAANIKAITTDAVGNILVGGSAYAIPGQPYTQGFLARITSEGVMDYSFGTNGVVITDITPGVDENFTSVNVQSNGAIIAAGQIRRDFSWDLLAAKFSANGTQDLTLNNNTGYFVADLKTGSFEETTGFVQGGTILYGTGNMHTDLSADLLLIALDLNSAVLPITISSFSARAEANKGLLEWVTESKQELIHYVVERSSDGINFDPLATVSAKSQNGRKNYTYLDIVPLPGKNYYRIKAIDFDRSSVFTPIKMVNFNTTYSLKVYPNPAQDYVNIIWQCDPKKSVEITLYDNYGRRVQTKNTNHIKTVFDIRHLPSGTYYVYAENQIQGTFLKN